jgi:simple sugar transport system ATP-binding protein
VTEALIALLGVSKRFGGVQALAGVSLTLAAGEIHCLAGENGSGKSTLIKIIAGVESPDAGEITLAGERLSRLDPKGAIARGIQVIYQDFSLFPSLSVAENLALPSRIAGARGRGRRFGFSAGESYAIARAAIARLGIDLPLAAEVGTLATGERQLVAIARALVSAPRLLIMDEPTTALTGREIERLFAVVRELRAQGLSILFVSHKIREMFAISERITVLRNGLVVAEGEVAAFDEASLARAMIGEDLAEEPYRWPDAAPSVTPRLVLSGFSVPGEIEALDLAVFPGEIVGVAGLLGGGRTELALALFGFRPHYRGEVRLDGVRARLSSVAAAVAAGIAYVPEDRLTEGLFLAQSIDRNLLAASLARWRRWLLLDLARAEESAAVMRAEMAINTPDGARPVATLSGGNQQRVMIGRWLLRRARLLILNGPTVGVDIGSKAGLHRRIRALAEKGLAVLMISDDLPELVQNCNRVVMLHRGRLAGTFAAPALSEEGLAEQLRALV